jgi:ribose 5-phosphate isomerase B
MKKLGIACDHAGYDMKEFLVGYLSSKGYEMIDFGTHSEESIDYPDFGHALAEAIESGELKRGIGLCGSGEGMAMTLNKHQGIRAGLCWKAEIAGLTRQHNDANVVVLPARFISNDEAMAIVDAFLNTEFEGGRHVRRVEKIACK